MPSSLRSCEIVQQLEYLQGFPDNWEARLVENLEGTENIVGWAYVVHDRDLQESGAPIPPHVHIVIILAQPVKESTVGGYVGVPAQYVNHIRQKYLAGRKWYSDVGGALSYLTHRNAPEKYQYPDSDVKAKPGWDWIAIRTASEARQSGNKSLQKIYEGIEKGEIRRYNLYEHMSMVTYIEHRNDIDKALEYYETKLKNTTHDRNISIIYIYGSPESGKTTLAKKYCTDKGLSYCVSASTRDPAQDYAGQDVLILDDLRPETFSLPDLLKLLDRNTSSSVNSRYRDKWLMVSVIIITTVFPIEQFYKMTTKRNEPVQQLYRRCRTMIRLTATNMDLFIYRHKIGTYMLVSSGPNPITKLYPPDQREVSEEELQQICTDFGMSYSPEGLPSDYLIDDISPF